MLCTCAVCAIHGSARGSEGSPNGGERTVAFWLPGATDPRQRRGWEQAAATTGVSEHGEPSGFRSPAPGVLLTSAFVPAEPPSQTHALWVCARLCSCDAYMLQKKIKIRNARVSFVLLLFADGGGGQVVPSTANPLCTWRAAFDFWCFDVGRSPG